MPGMDSFSSCESQVRRIIGWPLQWVVHYLYTLQAGQRGGRFCSWVDVPVPPLEALPAYRRKWFRFCISHYFARFTPLHYVCVSLWYYLYICWLGYLCFLEKRGSSHWATQLAESKSNAARRRSVALGSGFLGGAVHDAVSDWTLCVVFLSTF